jgi:hypothetical protein
MKRRLLAPLLAAIMLIGLAVAAPRAEATGYFYTCPQALSAKSFKCTWTAIKMNVLDRTTGKTITWNANTTVGMGHWTNDWSGKCGIGDNIVWAVWWLVGGVKHYAIVPDWYLDTGYIRDWGPLPAEYTGTYHYNPDMKAGSDGTGPCNGSGYPYLASGG